MCFSLAGDSSLVPPPVGNMTFADCPGGEFGCHDLSAPPLPGASIQCASDLPDDAGWAEVCCVSGSACFDLQEQGLGSSTDGYYPQGGCAPGEYEYFCTGTAALAPGACRPAPVAEAGAPPTQAPAFCCPSDYVPSVSYVDAGLVEAGLDAGVGD